MFLGAGLALCHLSKADAQALSQADAYVLAEAEFMPPVGTKLTTIRKMDMTKTKVTMQMEGKEMQGSATNETVELRTSERISSDVVREVETQSLKKASMTLNGQGAPLGSNPSPLLNVPYVMKKQGGTWKATLENSATPSGVQQAKLTEREKQYNKNTDAVVYGTAPRRIGDTWTVNDPTIFFNGEDGTVGTETALTLTFKGVESYQGKPCARLEGHAKYSGKSAKGAWFDHTMSIDAKVVVLRSLTDYVDLKSETSGQFTMNMSLTNGGTLKLEGPASFVGEVTTTPTVPAAPGEPAKSALPPGMTPR